MKRWLFGAVLFILVFTGSALTFNFIGNREYNTKSVEAVESTLEKAYISFDGQKINPMDVYRTKLLTGAMRESVVPVDDSKTVTVIIPDSISEGRTAGYELRDQQGVNLIEDGKLIPVRDGEGENEYSLSIRMDMTVERDYSLVFVFKDEENEEEGETYYYYTRVKRTSGEKLSGMIEYAESFSNTILEENQRTVPEESVAEGGYYGDITEGSVLPASESDAVLSTSALSEYFEGGDKLYHTYGHTVYNSRYDKAIMTGLGMSRVGGVTPVVKEISKDNAVIALPARMISRSGEDVTYYTMTEYYTLEYDAGKNGFVLKDYERLIDESFTGKDVISNTGRLKLGLLSDEDPEYAASEDSSRTAFVMDNALWYYSAGKDFYTKIYGQSDLTTLKDSGYKIRILAVDEDEIDFIVYGRIPQGSHMGYNGIALYSYTLQGNSIKEIDFIETDLSVDLLKDQVGRYAYYDRNGRYFYILLDNRIIKINVLSNEKEELVSGIPYYYVYVSKDKSIIAYPDSSDMSNVNNITIFSVKDGTTRVESVPGEKLSILCFMGDDLVYGAAKPEMVTTGADGTTAFMFDQLKIVDKNGNVKKHYQKDNVYISSARYENNNLYLTRMSKNEEGKFTEISTDYISESQEEESDKLQPAFHYDDAGIGGIYLDFPGRVYVPDGPDEIITRLARGDKPKKTFIAGSISNEVYYIFGNYGLLDVTLSAGEAIQRVSNGGGFITDPLGNVIYREKEMRPYFTVAGSFDYMAGKKDASEEETLYMCEYMAMLQAGVKVNYEDVSGRRDWSTLCSEFSGGTVKGINLSGAEVDVAIGYLSDGSAFIAKYEDSYVLVLSYNSDFIRYLNPRTGQEERVERWYFNEEVRKNGNELYAWFR